MSDGKTRTVFVIDCNVELKEVEMKAVVTAALGQLLAFEPTVLTYSLSEDEAIEVVVGLDEKSNDLDDLTGDTRGMRG